MEACGRLNIKSMERRDGLFGQIEALLQGCLPPFLTQKIQHGGAAGLATYLRGSSKCTTKGREGTGQRASGLGLELFRKSGESKLIQLEPFARMCALGPILALQATARPSVAHNPSCGPEVQNIHLSIPHGAQPLGGPVWSCRSSSIQQL